MTQEEKTQLEERIVDVLKTVYDPEIPVNIYDLGMIYKSGLYPGGCAHEGGVGRGYHDGECELGVRAGVGPEYDE